MGGQVFRVIENQILGSFPGRNIEGGAKVESSQFLVILHEQVSFDEQGSRFPCMVRHDIAAVHSALKPEG